jgi:hypothetical protein
VNTWERFHIYKLRRDHLQINDTYTDIHNPIFNSIKINVMAKIILFPIHPPHCHPLPLSLTPYPHHNQNNSIHYNSRHSIYLLLATRLQQSTKVRDQLTQHTKHK